MRPSENERQSLCVSVERLLQKHWPIDDIQQATRRANDPEAIRQIYRQLADSGISTLGSNPEEGGLQEILALNSIFGKFSVLTPLLGTFVANMALTGRTDADGAVTEWLHGLHEGKFVACAAFGDFDSDSKAEPVTVGENGCLTGVFSGVEDALSATHILVFLRNAEKLMIVNRDHPGVAITETPGLTVPSLAEIRFDGAAGITVADCKKQMESLHLMAKLCLAARAYGAVNCGFEMATEYAKERKQFGVPIGRFQAVQHKLADNAISLQGVKLVLSNAAEAHDRGDKNWNHFAQAAFAYASPTLRKVALENHHIFGAIGYAEEHPLPQQFRRVHGDMSRFGGPFVAHEELAKFLIDSGNELPDYNMGEKGDVFREKIRKWLDETGQTWMRGMKNVL